MPNDSNPAQALVRASNYDLQTMQISDAVEAYSPQFAEALPDNIPLQKFKRTVLTALNMSPDLARADRRSLFNACVKCAHDGLYPDGREAALVIFNTKVKRDGKDEWIKAVQYLPMIAGIRKRMRNSGEVISAEARVVYENDVFHYRLGEDPQITHEPAPMMADPGRPVGAYAIIKLKNGEVLREIMRLSEIERARSFSKTGDSDGSPWKTSWSEMARKTVLRRCAKSAPNDAEMERLFNRDDEYESTGTPIAIPRRPQPTEFARDEEGGGGEIEHESAGETETSTEEEGSTKEGVAGSEQKIYAVVDADGIVFESASMAPCEGKLLEYLSEASGRGKNVLDGVWESNAALIDELAAMAAPATSPALEHYQFLLKQHAPKDGAATVATQSERRRRRPPGSVNRPKPMPSASNEPPAWVTDGPPLAGAALPDAPSANAASTGSAIGNPQQNPEVPPPVRSPVVVPPASGPKPPGSPIIGDPSQASASPIAGGALQPVPTRQADTEQMASGNDEGRPAMAASGGQRTPSASDDALRVRYIDQNVSTAFVHARQLLDRMRDRRAPTEEYTRFRVINDDFLRDGESAMGDWFKPIKLAVARGERGE